MHFDVFRISLLKKQQEDMFVDAAASGGAQNREDFLRYLFGSPIKFKHRGAEMHFVPDNTVDSGHLIAGRIGRASVETENDPPEDGLHEKEREAWHGSLVLIDPRHHADGQKLAMADKQQVGKPNALLLSLAKHFNEVSRIPNYVFEIGPIINAETFWTFVEKNKGQVTSVKFEVIAPNMFGQRHEFDREMRQFRDNEKAERVNIELKSEHGLELNTQRVENAVAYAAESGGNIIAKTPKKRYNSKKNTKRVTIPKKKKQKGKKNGSNKENPSHFLARVVEFMKGIFTP